MAGVVLAFGTFDTFHPGHEYFLRQARRLGTRLVVAVARDEHVRTLKKKEPKRPEGERLETVRGLPYVDEAVLSDPELGRYRVIDEQRPDVIALGHDQSALEGDLRRWLSQNGRLIELVKIGKYEPPPDVGGN